MGKVLENALRAVGGVQLLMVYQPEPSGRETKMESPIWAVSVIFLTTGAAWAALAEDMTRLATRAICLSFMMDGSRV